MNHRAYISKAFKTVRSMSREEVSLVVKACDNISNTTESEGIKFGAGMVLRRAVGRLKELTRAGA